jgi:hypothetical protein
MAHIPIMTKHVASIKHSSASDQILEAWGLEETGAILRGNLNSGAIMIDKIFDWCVVLLVYGADLLGITYKAINVWIFVVVWPIFTLALIIIVIRQQAIIRRLLKQENKRAN